MKNQSILFVIIIVVAMIFSALVVLFGSSDYQSKDENTPAQTTPTPTPEPKPLEIEVKVTPWGDMYRKEPDCKEDFSIELVHPNQNENFTTNTFNITMNAGAYFWIVQKAYYTSDLFSGERWIPISKSQGTIDLQKTFTFNLTNVPNGQHELTLTVIFHEGTRNQTTLFFNVLN
jgi:hypothetical protein